MKSKNNWENQPRKANGQFTFLQCKENPLKEAFSDVAKKTKEKVLMAELEKQNVKFSKEKLKFITRDKSGQIIFLETGSEAAGLEHIILRHELDFKKAFGVEKDDIPKFLERVISDGTLLSSQLKSKNGRMGCEKIYEFNGKLILLAGIGTNGYLVSAYPIK